MGWAKAIPRPEHTARNATPTQMMNQKPFFTLSYRWAP